MVTRFSRILSETERTEEILPDGTVRIETDSYISYNKNGRLHRIDGPAWVNKVLGIEQWFANGVCHRTDGPAIQYGGENGGEYRISGRLLTKEEFLKHFDEK